MASGDSAGGTGTKGPGRLISFHNSLLVNMGVLILVLVIAILSINLYTIRQAIAQLSGEVLDRNAELTRIELGRFFSPIRDLCLVARDWSRNESIDLMDPSRLNPVVIPYLSRLEQVASLNVAGSEGQSLVLIRTETNWVTRLGGPSGINGSVGQYASWDLENGRWLAEWETQDDFDARTQPWFSGAVEHAERIQQALSDRPVLNRDVFWTDPFQFYGNNELGVAASILLEQNQSQTRVFALNVRLKDLSRFTSTLRPSEDGMVVIFDQSGRMVGLPRVPERYGPIAGQQEMLTEIRSSPVPPVRLAAEEWVKRTDRSGSVFRFKADGARWWAGFYPHALGTRLVWISVLVEEDDLLGPLRLQRTVNLALLGVALAAAFFKARQLAGRFSRPVQTLVAQSEQIRRLHLQERDRVRTPIRELQQLADAQENMREALNSFTRYVPTGVVRELLDRGEAARIGGRTADVTVMFSDIRGFTVLSEKIDPNELALHLGDYFRVVLSALEKCQATVDKIIGDAVMSFWGAPQPDPLHARHAVEAAMLVKQEVRSFNERVSKSGRPPLRTQFGIATGTVLVGNIGSPTRMNYTVLGDSVNLASRLEALNPFLGTDILASGEAMEATRSEFAWRRVLRVAVRGKSQHVDVFEPMGRVHSISNEEKEFIKAYETALERFEMRSFEEASRLLNGLAEPFRQLDSVTFLMEQCRLFQAHPPAPEWDGGVEI